jgi:hypothetical protein
MGKLYRNFAKGYASNIHDQVLKFPEHETVQTNYSVDGRQEQCCRRNCRQIVS